MEERKNPLTRLTAPLLEWYEENRRSLPWREVVSPYRTWVSEIMLQQTRVTAVLPYFQRFMQALPDIAALAAVPDAQLMKLWEGLGYYSRARNLKKAAQQVMERWGGNLPGDQAALCSLPGIGVYTAGAILSIAFGQAVPAVDGNVMRVYARLLGDSRDITQEGLRQEYRQLAAEAISREHPGAYNQALMDLGATVCLPHGTPDCDACPARQFCQAHQNGQETVLPVRREKKQRRQEARTVFVLWQEGRVALHRRSDKGLLAGLWEFPQTEGALEEKQAIEWLEKQNLLPLIWQKKLSARHQFTHVEWEMTAYVLTVRGGGDPDWLWAEQQQYRTLAIPSAFARFDKEVQTVFEERREQE